MSRKMEELRQSIIDLDAEIKQGYKDLDIKQQRRASKAQAYDKLLERQQVLLAKIRQKEASKKYNKKAKLNRDAGGFDSIATPDPEFDVGQLAEERER